MKIRFLFALLTSAILCACSSFNSDSEKFTFDNLDTYYINTPQGGINVFLLPSVKSITNTMLVEQIQQQLDAKGFKRVEQVADAQFVVSPVFNEVNFGTPYPQNINDPIVTQIGEGNFKCYATLELQVFLPNSNACVWRGFSNVKIFGDLISKAVLANSVTWCLEDFPCPQKAAAKDAQSAQAPQDATNQEAAKAPETQTPEKSPAKQAQ